MKFEVIAESVVGPSHAGVGGVCEDSWRNGSSPDGKWSCFVVTDGCGSEEGAHVGAEFLAKEVLSGLLGLAPKLESATIGDWIIDEVVMVLATIRLKMAPALGEPIQKFSATLVAAMLSESGGFLVHIGDGIATALSRRGSEGGSSLSVVGESRPENGEYANQTFYLTGSNWIHHVRLTPIPNPDLLLLATDGAQTLLYQGDNLFAPAFDRLLKDVLKKGKNPTATISKFLGSKEAAALSGDDKTLAMVFRPGAQAFLEGARISETKAGPNVEASPTRILDSPGKFVDELPAQAKVEGLDLSVGILAAIAVAVSGLVALAFVAGLVFNKPVSVRTPSSPPFIQAEQQLEELIKPRPTVDYFELLDLRYESLFSE
jgi:hypothetical protein